jgi:N-acetyl-anhydromuramyl-L-alanine amidase AmpD
MTLTIRAGRVIGPGVRFLAANSSGGPIAPSLIVLHDTAGRLEKGSSVGWFRDKKCTTSAHFVVERDGSVAQMVPLDSKAFHCGESVWQGRRYANSFAIGIEIVNPGKMDHAGKAWFGQAVTSDLDLVQARTREHGDGWWLPYTPEQIDAVKALCRAIMAAYPDVNDIATHWMISPGRKIDTCPLLPLDDIVAYANGEIEPETADVPAAPVTPLPAPPATMATSTTGQTAIALGAGGTVTAATEVSTAMALVAKSGATFSAAQFALALAQSPTFWIAVLTVAGAAYVWLERRAKLVRYGI